MDLHADQSGAATLLDQAGWVLENGKRMKNGKQLSLYLVSYPFRPGLGIMAPLIKASLESLGINVTADNVPLWSDQYSHILRDRTYDLLMWAQHTLPNGDPQWFLNAFFRGNPMDSRNYAHFNSSIVDGLLDDFALAETANDARINAASAAHSAILAQVPVSNLVTPQWHIGVTNRLSKYDPWGADYYVIRADFHDDAITVAPTPMPTAAPAPEEASSANHINLSGLSVVSILFLCSMYSK
jgi:peptide/nickel transport system substrate-binding protein